jgi:hypothetical protein
MYDPRSLRRHVLHRLLLAPLAAIGLTACGVAFSSTFEGTEMFEGISLEGPMTPGSELTLYLTVNISYPVPLEIACFWDDSDTLTKDQQKIAFHDRAATAGRRTIEAAPAGTKPGDDVEDIVEVFTFPAPNAAGDYFIACLTPAAPDNGIGLSFDIVNN